MFTISQTRTPHRWRTCAVCVLCKFYSRWLIRGASKSNLRCKWRITIPSWCHASTSRSWNFFTSRIRKSRSGNVIKRTWWKVCGGTIHMNLRWYQLYFLNCTHFRWYKASRDAHVQKFSSSPISRERNGTNFCVLQLKNKIIGLYEFGPRPLPSFARKSETNYTSETFCQ